RDRDASFLALQNLFAVEVTAVGDDIELVHVERRFRLLGHMGELRPIGSLIGYLMRHDQMMLCLDGNLDVVAHNTRAASAGCHRAGMGSVSEICWSGVASISTLRISRRRICSFSFSIFSFRRLVLVLSTSDGSCRSV